MLGGELICHIPVPDVDRMGLELPVFRTTLSYETISEEMLPVCLHFTRHQPQPYSVMTLVSDRMCLSEHRVPQTSCSSLTCSLTGFRSDK